MPLVALDPVSQAFGHLPLLGEAMLRIGRGERICVVGRTDRGLSGLFAITLRFARRLKGARLPRVKTLDEFDLGQARH